MHFVAYLRVSGKGQVDGNGFDRQIHAIMKWAEQNGHHVLISFKDEGVSGTLVDRPALAEAISFIQKNRSFDTPVGIVVERVDRLARDLIVSEALIRELTEMAIPVWSAEGDERLDSTDDPTRIMVRQIMGAISEYEKSSLVSKLRRARARKRERGGRCEGVRPFGELPGEDDALEAIGSLSRAGFGPVAICRALNDYNAGRAGWPLPEAPSRYMLTPRGGGVWHPGTISKILKRIHVSPVGDDGK